MSSAIGVWFLILVIVLAFMAIKNHEPKRMPEPDYRPIVPPVIARRPRMEQPTVTREQRFATLQAEYQQKLSLLQRAIPNEAHRRLAEQSLYANYLRKIEELLM